MNIAKYVYKSSNGKNIKYRHCLAILVSKKSVKRVIRPYRNKNKIQKNGAKHNSFIKHIIKQCYIGASCTHYLKLEIEEFLILIVVN